MTAYPATQPTRPSRHLGEYNGINVSDVDPDLQRRCGHTDAKPVVSHLLLYSRPLTGRQGPEMEVNRPPGAEELLVKMRRHGVRTIAGIDEHEQFLGARPLEPPSELPSLRPVSLSGFLHNDIDEFQVNLARRTLR